jgi:hypothetical protein
MLPDPLFAITYYYMPNFSVEKVALILGSKTAHRKQSPNWRKIALSGRTEALLLQAV